MSETARRFFTVLVCLLMGVAVGVVVTEVSLTGGLQPPVSEEIRQGTEKYTEIMELVDQYFIGEDVDPTQVGDAMAAGIIEGLGDRWSYYVSAEDYQSYMENLNNSYVGVGITISAQFDEDGNPLGFGVSDVTDGGPAEEAGVKPGDILTGADDQSVVGATITETRNLVKGVAGTKVNLTFLRDGEEYTVTVERRALEVIPARGQLLRGSVGYIVIDNFDERCAQTVIGLIEELKEQGAASILFDVRNNPGGLKRELTDLLDYLLPEGTVFHTVNYAGDEEIVTSDAEFLDMPMAVLVNGDSYSAAEYFACALQEYGAGIVIGEKTFGKGYYQVGMQLSDGSCVNLSIGKYFTPNGLSLIDVGVTPDIELPLSDEEAASLAKKTLDPAEDPQIQAAIDCLQP